MNVKVKVINTIIKERGERERERQMKGEYE